MIFLVSTLSSTKLYETLKKKRQQFFFDPWGYPRGEKLSCDKVWNKPVENKQGWMLITRIIKLSRDFLGRLDSNLTRVLSKNKNDQRQRLYNPVSLTGFGGGHFHRGRDSME